MNKEKIKSQLLNLIAVLFFCFVFCVTDGIIGFFASVFASVFLGCAITKHYYGFFVLETSMILAIITAFYTLMAGALGFAAGIKEAAMIVLLGSALGIATNVGFTVGKTILLCSAVYFADVLIGILLSQDSISYSMLLEELGTVITDSITTQYGSQPEVVAMTEELIREMIMLSYKLMPAMFIGISVLSAFILTVIYKKMLSKINKDIVPLTNIADLRGNKILGIIFLISLFAGVSSTEAIIADALLNFCVILGFVLYFFGLTYIMSFMIFKGVNKTSRQITVIIVLPLVTFLFAVPAFVIGGIGFLDCFCNYRKNFVKKEDENGN